MLTPKQEAFCIEVLKHGNASEAYRNAYASAAAKSNDNSINRRAHELMHNGKIIARLQELRAPAIKNARISLESHLEDLLRLRTKAEASEKYQAAIQAEVARGKASGLYIEKIEHSGSIELKTFIESLSGSELPIKK